MMELFIVRKHCMVVKETAFYAIRIKLNHVKNMSTHTTQNYIAEEKKACPDRKLLVEFDNVS